MYFINHVQTYSSVNKKGKELCEFVLQFERKLIRDEIALDALKQMIESKVKELNEKYPKTKEMTYDGSYFDFPGGQITCKNLNDSYQPVCFITYKVVAGTYEFSEQPEKVIPASIEHPRGICRICGCTDNDPCFNPKFGACWWMDEKHTICSHCKEPLIANDPDTIHCINTKGNHHE